ncbi:uncharacterized protein BXZ73DRAFT_48547, partial [Epithele typhae]|uniref:uncharacterized protein n=1 Tax=Epithele typhae TaxID=378194 RepID=UPI002007E783
IRAGSVSSLGGVGPSIGRKGSTVMHAAPKFQTQRVAWRGLTMEAAQWTLTSQQLQHIVSTAIRTSADASMIRILPLEALEEELPAEIERTEAHIAELKTRYKLGVRKRNTLFTTVGHLTERGDPAEAARALEELSDLTENLDFISEELYMVTDQLAQLYHLRDVHERSALAMALRKLNSSFLKQVGEVQRLREQVATLEAERDEAWREAQEVAQEFDDYTERVLSEPGSSRPKDDKDSITTPSRRSSRVTVARKNSQRASKAGLRSMHRRSHRSSTSSNHRYSGVASPGAWGGPNGDEEIPPVPPIPQRRDLMYSERMRLWSHADSPSSELRAMVQAQRELCEMLGISLEELKIQNLGPSRRQSMSAIHGARSPVSPALTRRNSDIITPNHQKTFKSTGSS